MATKKQRNTQQKRARSSGWLTTDADEIERRRSRGIAETIRIESQTTDDAFFGRYLIHADSGQYYQVEIRSLTDLINSCNCPDHVINGLGTCKHIEATLQRLAYRRKRLFRKAAAKGSPFVEIFLDRRDHQVRICWPQGSQRRSMTRNLLAPFFNDEGALMGDPLDTVPTLERSIKTSPTHVRRRIRISTALYPWLEKLDRQAEQRRSRQHFETEVAMGNASLDVVMHPLYPYQREGMLHLAFTGRALLADEMGLGKTVQAIAACELLRRIFGIRRVLVISPASLKGEWQEQIAKFTRLPSCIIQGPRANRLRQYEEPAFFSLANYEQIRPDVEDINTTLAPDVIILDEAQRIKNWQTKTAGAVKRLNSPYAFVLTGTPLENRIDEIYSITQFLDPQLFGPLFRFNRDFYELDEKGHAIGYKHLDRLHERLQSVMLRRRKEEVEGQLPGRTINTYFVPMHKEQSLRYEEYAAKVARIANIAQTRPLKKEEMERLQQYLACMRMLCDTPYILDQNCRQSPKMEELDSILQEIMQEDGHKIIIFSEWERMLQLVREKAEEKGLGYAWHTGKIPQPKRRDEIRRFKSDPECHLFLSTDSGSVGLNLQVADIVINLDIPWNPAKLEQRIARAWRKHQKRPVQVINLVSENTIEHRMLGLLEQKRSLAAGVLDGKGENAMALPSGRAAFLERIDALMSDGTEKSRTTPTDPLDRLRDNILAQWQNQLQRMELHNKDGRQTLLVVADTLDDKLHDALTQQLKQQLPDPTPQLHLLDQETFGAIGQLIEAGILKADPETARILYRASETTTGNEQANRLSEALAHLAPGEHKRRMANVLTEGGFSTEALAPMCEALETALQALALWQGCSIETPPDLALIDSMLVKTNLPPAEVLSLVTALRENQAANDETRTTRLLAQGDRLFLQVASLLTG